MRLHIQKAKNIGLKESHIIGMITAIGEEEEIVKLNYSQIILAY